MKSKPKVKIEQVDSNIGKVFRVVYLTPKTGKFISFLKNESCHVTRNPNEAMIKINRKDAESNGNWCAGKRPGWPRTKRQRAYQYFLEHSHYPPACPCRKKKK